MYVINMKKEKTRNENPKIIAIIIMIIIIAKINILNILKQNGTFKHKKMLWSQLEPQTTSLQNEGFYHYPIDSLYKLQLIILYIFC